MSDIAAPDRVAYYSILRFVPDPLRDEPINVGLFIVSEDGEWARFDVHVPKTRLIAVNRRSDAERIEEWARTLKEQFDVGGLRGLFDDRGRISRSVLDEWAQSFSASLRVTEPRVAVEQDLDVLWVELFKRLVRVGSRREPAAAADRRRIGATTEKREIVRAFVGAAKRWPTFDPTRLHYGKSFEGRKAAHFADLAIVNGHVTGIMQALPLAAGSAYEVISTRALLLDAAVDLDPDVVKLALYRDPPSDRRDMLAETRSILVDARRSIRLVSTRSFDSLAPQLANTLFPPEELDTGR